MSVTLTVIGSGDAFGTAGRLQPCFLLEHDQGRTLVDCGASSLAGLRAREIDPSTISTVLLSHLHGDHFGGVPFLLLDALYVTARKAPLIVAGPPGVEGRVLAVLELFYPGAGAKARSQAAVTFMELDAGTTWDAGGLVVKPFPAVHGSGAPSYAFRLAIDRRVVGYSGDTGWTDALFEVSRDANLFICECSTFDTLGSTHISYRQLERQLPQLSARRLILTHVGPDVWARRDEVKLEIAHDGLVVAL